MQCWKNIKLLLLLCISLLLTRTAKVEASSESSDETINELLLWLESKGGYFNEKAAIRRLKSPDSRVGVFSKGDIKKDEIILHVPKNCLITGSNLLKKVSTCDLARSLYNEIELGDESEFKEYLKYLTEENRENVDDFPVEEWSEKGEEMLFEILFDGNLISQSVFEHTARQECSSPPYPNNLVFEKAYEMSVDKGGLHIPVYDTMRYRERGFNAKATSSLNSIMQGKGLKIRASRDIKEGEEIFRSSSVCEGCEENEWVYTTIDLLRDKGKVASFPQYWEIGQFMAYELDFSDKFEVEWVVLPTNNRDLAALRNFHVPRLEYLGNSTLKVNEYSLYPAEEWKILQEFYNALKTSIVAAIDDLDSICLKEAHNFCQVKYDDMKQRDAKVAYSAYPCLDDTEDSVSHYEVLDDVRSHYQHGHYVMDPANKDTCFSLDGTYQICSSYRPHYHEMVVHYTARYLREIKRVVWVGGGDSMLLHEIIKYPTLEFVIGLEIDQKVTRYAFKNFGTQPHWDNKKVQWWYGDAAKSLLMLPKEYYGSFDMVLVDLSETVTSNSVTDELDIFDAMSLLLKPDGIFVKNEHYIQQMSKVFNYALSIEYTDVAWLCAQTLILGSNQIDFLYEDIKNHHIDNLYYQHPQTNKSYDIWHDYRKNLGNDQKHCKNPDELHKELTQQNKSPGIIMIVEAEDIAINIKSATQVKDLILNALKDTHLSVLDSFVSDDGTSGIVVCREGYVLARVFPSVKYCSLDIHLWSSFEKLDSVKNSILNALQSQASSSYRIVAGGMFGVSTWKEDEQNRGPQFKLCDTSPSPIKKMAPTNNLLDVIIEESLTELIHETNAVAVVLCDEPSNCNTLKMTQNNNKVTETIPLACPGLKSKNKYRKPSISSLLACEKTILDTLSKQKKIHAIVLDPLAPKEIAQILYSIIDNRVHKRNLFSPNLLVLASVNEPWKNNWLDRFRQHVIVHDPCFLSYVFFDKIEMGFVSNHKDFVFHLVQANSNIQQKTNVVPDVKDIFGAYAVYQPEFEADQFFPPDAYDQSSPLEQWKSQQPVAFQIVFQLETKKVYPIKPASLKGALSDAISVFSKSSPVMQFNGLGDGALFVSFIQDIGTVVVTWDSKTHVDVNLCTYKEDVTIANKFINQFQSKITSSNIVLRDEQPRGYGRVVNFANDIKEPRADPFWASGVL